MRGPNEFWLCYHRLLKAYEEEGESSEARSEHIIDEFIGCRHLSGNISSMEWKNF